ncbi:MAG: hypothetical protein ACREFU_11780 [Acetobacteraceae bacterium]
MQIALAVTLAGLAVAAAAPAVAGTGHFAYNDTAVTSFGGVYFAPAGTTRWGPNQALNDDDKELDFGERLTLTGLDPGLYDVTLIDKKGRTCIMRKVDLTRAASFDIRDADLARCQ